MKSKIISFLKFTLILIFMSVVISFVCFIFGQVLVQLSNLAFNLYPYNLLFLPLVGVLIVYLKSLKKEQVDNSMLKVFNATQYKSVLSIYIIPFQMITTWLSHLTGASVGREGVALQLGATVANNVSHKFKLDSKMLTSAGKAAGFSGLFGTPIAGVFFAYEMNKQSIKDYKFWYSAILMSFLSSYLTGYFGLNHFHKHLNIEIGNMITVSNIIKMITISLIFILVGNLFVICLKWQKKYFNSIFKNEYKKVIVLSVIFVVVMFLLTGRYMSLGTNLIDMAFNNPSQVLYVDFILKLLLTTYIIAVGFQGGEVTPLFSIGATLGVVLGLIFNLPVAIVAALGYSYVFGNATNAYIASFFICIEVFGIKMLPLALIFLIISYFFKNKTSIYPLY